MDAQRLDCPSRCVVRAGCTSAYLRDCCLHVPTRCAGSSFRIGAQWREGCGLSLPRPWTNAVERAYSSAAYPAWMAQVVVCVSTTHPRCVGRRRSIFVLDPCTRKRCDICGHSAHKIYLHVYTTQSADTCETEVMKFVLRLLRSHMVKSVDDPLIAHREGDRVGARSVFIAFEFASRVASTGCETEEVNQFLTGCSPRPPLASNLAV
eukprot:362927-Chlamydomonas_euryale.AAC.10